ncbi:MAG: ATP-binding cassette domain-containing protein, partial [Ruthenibacterium sp.]
YDTVLSEGGAMISQGQRQLLALARTMAADPKILILDEATSSIDTKTERALQIGLNRMMQGRTSFIVAHRLSTIKACDKIMYIENGQIRECGTHATLMQAKGLYYQLCRNQ